MPGDEPQVAPLEEHLGKRKPEGAIAHVEGKARAAALASLARGYAAAVEESARIRAEEQLTPQALSRMVEAVALLAPGTALAAQALLSIAAHAPEAQGFRWPLRLCAGGGADGLRAALAGTTPGATLLLVEPELEPLAAACGEPGQGGFAGPFAGPTEGLPSMGEVASLFAPEVLRLVTLAGVEVEPLVLRAAVKAERVAGDPEQCGAMQLGALLAGLGVRGAQNVTLLVAPPLLPLARWLETLSMVLPRARPRLLVESAPEGPAAYGDDRLFVSLRLEGTPPDPRVRRLNAAGLPTLQLAVSPEELVAEAARWELSLAFAAGATRWPPLAPEVPTTAGPALEPALREGPLTLYATASHAFVLRKVAGTLGPKAAASVPHWLAAQLALGGPGDLASLHFSALQTAALEAALPSVQAAVRGATRLATRVRAGLGGLGKHAAERTGGGEGTLLFLLSDGGGQELGPAPGPAAFSRRAEEEALAAHAGAGRPALLLRAEDGDTGKLLASMLAAAALLAKPR
jgi:hypothetical protein